MRYGSVCSGIEAASVAWHPLGWEPQWFSEIEHFPSAVLKHRFPDVPNLGDMTQLNQNPVFNEQPIDLLVGGTPCQSFSVAGLRKGLADPRGNLMLTFLSIADKRRPKWIVWENVPGVLSSNGGRDFGTFLSALGNIGYGFAYRVLDAQHFGVAQRRRRVFVVGYLGDWRPAAAVLFESESLQRDIKPSRKKRQETPTDAQGSVGTTGNPKISNALCARDYKGPRPEADQGAPVIIEQVAQPIHAFKVRGGCEGGGKGYLGEDEKAFTISAMQDQQIAQPIAVDTYNYTTNDKTTQTIRSQSDTEHIGAVLEPKVFDWQSGGDARGLNLKDTAQLQRCQTPALLHTMAIRRLTPRECERLQGFPDDWTKIPYRNKPADQCPDGPRYKACGNSMAVPVMRWIGERIQMIENYLNP
jgi:DNA (cytosine-5)-methyltransferase 1